MNQANTSEKNSEARAALDHFAANIFPTLFQGETKKNGDYKRVYALVSERRKEIAGKPSKVSDSWIEKVLTQFGGMVDEKPRYTFETVTKVTIHE